MYICFAQGLFGLFMCLATWPKEAKSDRTFFHYWGMHANVWLAAATIIGALK